jgi:hypothetical protein
MCPSGSIRKKNKARVVEGSVGVKEGFGELALQRPNEEGRTRGP